MRKGFGMILLWFMLGRENRVPSCRLRYVRADKSQANDSQTYLANVYVHEIRDGRYLLGFNNSLNS